jgi:hypothetical protein
MTALELGVLDIASFNCGLRPNITEEQLNRLVLNRFSWMPDGYLCSGSGSFAGGEHGCLADGPDVAGQQ